MPRYSETYTFYTRSNDGVRLWVNGQLLIDNWTVHALEEDRGTITLQAGRAYSLRMEFYENRGTATAQLKWSSPSQRRQIIPAEC
ncbi:PA14 domain-containing protein, partial [Hyalangium sp.]|uniref:PA14 domain-containing protein n=1 Tax=Hyalangium sp. TaxID=2028555 RepID=UPI002D2733EA